MKENYKCKHPFPAHRVENNYVVCIQCGKKLADATGPLNEVFDKEDYEVSKRANSSNSITNTTRNDPDARF